VAISFYNTLTKKKEEFVPLEKGRVKIYACGITVYDLCHIGHARSALVFDVLVRYLQSKGFSVTYVRNITDVDDKIINKANEEGIDWKTIAERYIKEFYIDMEPFDLLKPTVEPKATDHIQEMISLIDILVKKGMAYESGGDVYFSVEKFKEYGKLSGAKVSEMQAQEPGENKRNRLDFTLWKRSKPGEPSWDTPWGPGRPGWHIECSAMSMKYLGETLDVHGGGMDLIFPHHENEIAQSESATGKPFARFWIHNGFVQINREKMSKSLGNIFTLREAMKRWHPEAIRYFLLSGHYRSPVDFTPDALDGAMRGLIRAYSILDALESELLGTKYYESHPIPEVKDKKLNEQAMPLLTLDKRIEADMDDDLNTPLAIGHIFDAISCINKLRQDKGMSHKEVKEIVLYGRDRIIYHARNILGILKDRPVGFLRWLREYRLNMLGITDHKRKEIDDAILAREEARKKKSWQEADHIRWLLQSGGIFLQDTPVGTKIEYRDEPLNTITLIHQQLVKEGGIEFIFDSDGVVPDISFKQKKPSKQKAIEVIGTSGNIKSIVENKEKNDEMIIYGDRS